MKTKNLLIPSAALITFGLFCMANADSWSSFVTSYTPDGSKILSTDYGKKAAITHLSYITTYGGTFLFFGSIALSAVTNAKKQLT